MSLDKDDSDNKVAPVTFTLQQGADYIGISYGMLRVMADRGDIPCIRCGNRRLFRKETIDKWIIEQERKSIEPIEENQYGKLRKIY